MSGDMVSAERRCLVSVSARSPSSAKKFGTGGLKRLGRLLRCGHDRAGGESPMLVMDRVRHAAILPSAMTARSGPKQCSQNIQKNRCRTTVAEPIGETLAASLASETR